MSKRLIIYHASGDWSNLDSKRREVGIRFSRDPGPKAVSLQRQDSELDLRLCIARPGAG